jgi:sec-independent protein translocase protein TatA
LHLDKLYHIKNGKTTNHHKGDKMFGLGFPELLIILIIAFFVFGANKLPEIGKDLGKGIRSFKKAISETENEQIDELPKTK